jgi:hypothetical protein
MERQNPLEKKKKEDDRKKREIKKGKEWEEISIKIMLREGLKNRTDNVGTFIRLRLSCMFY